MPDPRVMFEPELALRSAVVEPARRTWLPVLAPTARTVAPTCWLTRASRGFSWHRSGRALTRRVLR
jgi:hypothetical protein